MGGGLFFLERQCARIEERLLDEFKVVVLFDEATDEARRKVLEEKLKALRDVDDVWFVPKDESWQRLKTADGELAREVSFLGENPLPDSFDLTLGPDAMSSLGRWLEDAREIEGVTAVHFPAAQAEAFLQVRFYHSFLELTLAGSALLVLFGAGWSLARGGRLATGTGFGYGALGGALGTAASTLVTLPMQGASVLGGGLGAGQHLAVWSVAALVGWALAAGAEGKKI